MTSPDDMLIGLTPLDAAGVRLARARALKMRSWRELASITARDPKLVFDAAMAEAVDRAKEAQTEIERAEEMLRDVLAEIRTGKID